jgi:hypothetical protein
LASIALEKTVDMLSAKLLRPLRKSIDPSSRAINLE